MQISSMHLCSYLKVLHTVLSVVWFPVSLIFRVFILLMAVTNCSDARYFAVGSADSLVSLWNVKELLCIRTFTKLEYVP